MAEIRSFYYEEGNAARQVAEPLPSRRELEEQKRRKREDQERRAKKRRMALMRRRRMYAIYTTAVVALGGALFVGYVGLSNDITARKNHISELEAQVSDLKAENSTLSNKIETTANLSDIKTRAINDLGMVYADSSQIVYYDMESSDYMSQYSDLP